MTLAPGQPVDVNDILAEHDDDGHHVGVSNLRHGLVANRPASPVQGDWYISEDVPKISYCAVNGAWVDIIGGADEHVKVSSNDSTAGYLNGKLVADGVALTEVNDGGNETFKVGMLPGVIMPYVGKSAPSGWLICDGTAVSRTTYANLFAVMCPSMTFTVSIASPAVVTATGHGLSIGDRIRFTTTGALPTGMVAGTDYYIIGAGFGANSFRFSTSFGGAAVNTSGSQSGVHTVQAFGFGIGDGSTTFNLPDFRGRFLLGKDNMGGTSADRVTNTKADTMGQGDGEENHTLITAEMPAHSHTIATSQAGVASTVGNTAAGTTPYPTSSVGGDGAHNNMPPWMAVNYIVKS